MSTPERNVVTGAFGYTGKYIARRLLELGKEVRTLTGHPDRPNPFGTEVKAFPFSFDRPDELRRSLEGASTLYNTYWIRFPYGSVTYERAVRNTRTLIKAAEDAGVRRIVHVSITNACARSPLPYFRGKGVLEEAIAASNLSYAIIRPTVVFGDEDILINNIAWLVRRFPVLAIPGSGEYRLQPIYVRDMAEICVRAGGSGDNAAIDAVGPETYSYNELVGLIAAKIGRGGRVKLAHVPPGMVLLLGRLAGYMLGDVVITRDEIDGLMSNLLVSRAPPTGATRLSAWLGENGATVGSRYASELARHYRVTEPYLRTPLS